MQIPIYTPPSENAILWNQFIDLLEKEKGFSHRGFYDKEHREECERILTEWLTENNLLDQRHVLNYPEGSTTDWPADSPEMKMRIHINSSAGGFSSSNELADIKYPYVDFWHYIVDSDEISNGCYFYLERNDDWDYTVDKHFKYHGTEETREKYKHAMMQIENYIFEAAADFVDQSGGITFWVEW